MQRGALMLERRRRNRLNNGKRIRAAEIARRFSWWR